MATALAPSIAVSSSHSPHSLAWPTTPGQTLRWTAQRTPTTSQPVADPLAVGKERHRAVPPQNWCITRKDLRHLLREVRKALAQGDIPEDPSHPNPGHNNPKIGPSVYAVVEHVVKPMTFRAGGMSYALMRNPEGLSCDVFVTHAWAEGIFEFATKVLLGWPRGLKNLWCCLLALPQNLSITELLHVPLLDTPFARALHQAQLVIVVPNCSVSIYSRLWCVFEAYLATQADKDMVVPDAPSKSKLFKALAAFVFAPAILGWIIGGVMQGITFIDGLSKHEGAVLDAVARVLIASTLLKMVLSLGCRDRCGMHIPGCAAISIILTICHSVIDAYWVRLVIEGLVVFHPFARLFLGLIFITRFLLPIWETMRWLQARQVENLSRQLGVHFEGVHRATCSNEQDEERIRRFIAGNEDDVDHSIAVLMRAGAYSSVLSRADTLGLDVRNWGHTHSLSVHVGSIVMWTLSLFICANDIYWARRVPGYYMALPWALRVTLGAVLGCSVLLPLLALLCKWDRSRLILASRLWFFAAVWSLVGVIAGLGVPHIVDASKRYNIRLFVRPDYPPLRTAVVLWPGVCAVCAFSLAVLGCNVLLRFLDVTWQVLGSSPCPGLRLWHCIHRTLQRKPTERCSSCCAKVPPQTGTGESGESDDESEGTFSEVDSDLEDSETSSCNSGP